MKKKLCIILGFILVALFSNEKIQAQESKPGILPDTLQVSLLTCGPGTEVYELFGHTALRVKQQRPGGFDYVFNYGMFNFDVPGFIWRFTKGETDYCLGINDFPDFLLNYQFRESKVDEQVLNLTPIQSRALFEALLVNAMPQNRVYRYNFLFDNCATRPRNMVEMVLDNDIKSRGSLCLLFARR